MKEKNKLKPENVSDFAGEYSASLSAIVGNTYWKLHRGGQADCSQSKPRAGISLRTVITGDVWFWWLWTTKRKIKILIHVLPEC